MWKRKPSSEKTRKNAKKTRHDHHSQQLNSQELSSLHSATLQGKAPSLAWRIYCNNGDNEFPEKWFSILSFLLPNIIQIEEHWKNAHRHNITTSTTTIWENPSPVDWSDFLDLNRLITKKKKTVILPAKLAEERFQETHLQKVQNFDEITGKFWRFYCYYYCKLLLLFFF